MKAWSLIIMCFVLAFIIYYVIWLDAFHFTVNRKLKHGDCSIAYKQTYLTFDEELQWTNRENKHCAKVKLVKCLCGQYAKNKDSALKEYILKFYEENPEMHSNYARRVVFKVNPVLLLRHKEKIFREDSNALNAIQEYEGKDTSKLRIVLRSKYEVSNTAPSYYYQIIDTMPYPKPTIDSIVKYRDLVFSTFNCNNY